MRTRIGTTHTVNQACLAIIPVHNTEPVDFRRRDFVQVEERLPVVPRPVVVDVQVVDSPTLDCNGLAGLRVAGAARHVRVLIAADAEHEQADGLMVEVLDRTAHKIGRAVGRSIVHTQKDTNNRLVDSRCYIACSNNNNNNALIGCCWEEENDCVK